MAAGYDPARGDVTGNRLILLYLVNRMPYGIRHEDVLGLNLDHNWMLYFDLAQALIDLCEIGLLVSTMHDGERFYNITAEGMEVIELYRRRIPLSVRTQIDTYVQLNAGTIATRMEVSAQYEQNSAVDWTVTLKLMDHFEPLLQMHVAAPSETHARRICRRFEANAAMVYAQTLNLLTQEDEYEDL